MQIQKLSLPNHTLTFPHSSHINSSFSPPYHHSVSANRFNSKSGFCNSVKRVSTMRRFNSKSVMINSLAAIGKDGSDEGKDDAFYIRRCVELAKKAIGCTSPNPMVGCVIVKDGKIVGEGFHPKAGQPHAEVFALRDAGDLAENATAYVSLEPCNHYGRTPPCTEALIKAKVKKVVIGMVDPNPIVSSSGLDRLKDAGIDVTVRVEEELCKRLNEAYIHQMLTGKPFVTLRYSLSINGHFVNQLGEAVSEPGGYYSKLLQEYDAIITSASEFKSSIPASQEPGANQPLRVVIATSPSPIRISSLAEDPASKMIIFADKDTTIEPETARKGIDTVVSDRISLNEILEYCKRRGLCSVLLDLRGDVDDLEGLIGDAFEHNLLQKIIVEVLPLWDESSNKSCFAALKSIQRSLKVKNLQPLISVPESIVLEGYL